MDPWAELSTRLEDPLCAENDLALALENAADARASCPDASAANIKGSLAQVVGLTEDRRILDLASRVHGRLGKSASFRRGARRRSAARRRQTATIGWLVGGGDTLPAYLQVVPQAWIAGHGRDERLGE